MRKTLSNMCDLNKNYYIKDENLIFYFNTKIYLHIIELKYILRKTNMADRLQT